MVQSKSDFKSVIVETPKGSEETYVKPTLESRPLDQVVRGSFGSASDGYIQEKV